MFLATNFWWFIFYNKILAIISSSNGQGIESSLWNWENIFFNEVR